VLIFDDLCADWLARAVPKSARQERVSIRFSYPILFCWSFWRVLVTLSVNRLTRKGSSYSLIYLQALLESIQPKIVLSGADNNKNLAQLAHCTEDIQFIFVQTALRDTNQGFPRNISLPHYLAFGHCESNIFDVCQVKCPRYKPIGSLKLGYALSDPSPPVFSSTDLCFISDHRPGQPFAAASALEQAIASNSDQLFIHTARYARKNKLTLRVIGKAREPYWQRMEKRHYEELADNYFVEYISTDKVDSALNSYHAVFASSIVINNASTLGFEALVTKKKVLFGATMNSHLVEHWGVSEYFFGVPEIISLSAAHFSHFEEKLNALDKISASEYGNLVDAFALDVIAQDTNYPPHLKVQDTIKELIISG